MKLFSPWYFLASKLQNIFQILKWVVHQFSPWARAFNLVSYQASEFWLIFRPNFPRLFFCDYLARNYLLQWKKMLELFQWHVRSQNATNLTSKEMSNSQMSWIFSARKRTIECYWQGKCKKVCALCMAFLYTISVQRFYLFCFSCLFHI